jgi:hypothetical protein
MVIGCLLSWLAADARRQSRSQRLPPILLRERPRVAVLFVRQQTPVCESRVVEAPRVQDRRLLATATCPPDPKKPVGVFVSHEPQMTARTRLWHRHSVHGPWEAMPTASTWPESRTAREPATPVGQTASYTAHVQIAHSTLFSELPAENSALPR